MRALAHPALQLLAALFALVAFTWPLLVFDRPLYVFSSFYVVWLLMIGLLFLFSRAAPYAEAGAPVSQQPDSPDSPDQPDEARDA